MKGIWKYILVFVIVLIMPVTGRSQTMNDYCVKPPFIMTTLAPNIMLNLDFSGSMQWPAYLSCESYTCNSLNETYDPDTDYYGYFKSDKYYKYQSNKFFVNDTCTDTDRIGSPDCISGNLLNWATMSRVDVMRMALIGGKASSNQCNINTLYGEGSDWTVYDSNLGCSFQVQSPSGLSHRITISTYGSGPSQCTPDTVYSDDFNDASFDSKWTVADIGSQSPSVTSTITESGGNLSVQTNGQQIWSDTDEFTYVYQSVSGDFDIRVRVINPPGALSGQTWAKAGLMVRQSTATDSRHVMANVTYQSGTGWTLQFARRLTDGGLTNTFAGYVNLGNTNPVWLRLVRQGDTFYAYYSTDGTNWNYRGNVTVTMTDPVLIGLDVASYDASTSDTGVYDEFVYCQSSGGCPVGSLSNAYVRVDVPEGKRTEGVILEVADKDGDCSYDSDAPRIGLMTFSGSCARIRVGVDGADLSALINQIQNIDPSSSTPTAYAIQEAIDYFTQNDNYSNTSCNSSNNAFIQGQGSSKDPWYDNGTAVACRKSFLFTLSDGEWNTGGDPIDEVRESHVDDIRPDITGKQSLIHYTLFEAFGASAAGGRTAMQQIAMYGAFDDFDSNTWPYNRTNYPQSNSRDTSNLLPLNPCNPSDQWDEMCREWDYDADGMPDTYFSADSGSELVQQLRAAIENILKRASSGTAVSVLASGEGQGANLLQAVFYPKKTYGSTVQTELSWTGRLQNLWYYIDPFFDLSSIREDTISDSKLNLKQDYITSIYFDNAAGKTRASLCEDSDGDGDCDNTKPTVDFEELKNLWEAGEKLFQKSPSDRTIYTNLDDDSTLDSFEVMTTSNPTFESLLNASGTDEANIIIRYVRGEDLKVCSTTTTTVCTTDSDCPTGETCTSLRSRTATINSVTNTWKLGDIVHSTPRIQSWISLNNYYKRYNDNTYYDYVNDLKSDGSPKTTKIYTDRGMVYVGANDGMLHAFYLGKLEMIHDLDNPEKKAKITDPDTSDGISPGDEVWAFIPKNALPYLKYLKEPDYCHLYYVDASPFLFDASIGTTGCSETNYWDCKKTTDTWRTILIGSMRLGGACRDISSTCTDCVKTPTSNVGYSSYFALDITDQKNPKLLWEFSDPGLGFSTAGPVVVKVSPKTTGGSPDNTKNGRWFVVLPSGPTGPIDTANNEFKGKSDQNLKLFILDLKTGTLLRTIDTGIQNAFAGSQYYQTIDLDDDYQDDVMYISYVKKVGSGNNASWTGGGIIRLATSGSNSKTKPSIDPNDWKWSKFIEFDAGPVTTSVAYARSKKQHTLWLFFGTGRYFYKTDDPDGRRRLYGVKEPCYSSATDNISPTCTTTVNEGDLKDATTTTYTVSEAYSSSFKGWYVKLDCSATDNNSACEGNAPSGYSAERVITNPVASSAGVVFFTTFSPTSDLCGYGGNSYIWAVDYRTGGEAPSTALKGKALLQLSTGEIKEVAIKDVFTTKNNRRTASISGVPPQGEGIAVLGAPDPLKKFIFMKEK